jgi:ABC-type polysaccharide/polyol phosphate transport system ATPase subunit
LKTLSDSGAAVRLDSVSKRYLLHGPKAADFKTALLHLPDILRGRRGRQVFWALSDINLTVTRGESLGIIGPNGAGKSTLLRIVGKLARPTRGTVTISGRLSPLLELGAGFHERLTGRENALLNAVLLGLTKREALERMDAIIEFSELYEFIDEPMHTYSSGMYVRLGFSVAVHVDADILLVDEVLAVGDAEFQQKCFAHVDHLRERGVTIVLVSHDLDAVRRFCDRAILVEHGRIAAEGPPCQVIETYLAGVPPAEHNVDV